jgi:hypothetical protein
LAILSFEGTIPDEREELNMCESGVLISEIIDFKRFELIPSAPELKLLLSSEVSLAISSVDVGERKILVGFGELLKSDGGSVVGFGILVASDDPILVKNSLN